jgi:hypothetical protein
LPAIRIGVAAASLLGVVVLFQLALAAGAPWGAAAYGGRAVQDDGRLPTRYRVASAGTAVILTGALWLVLGASAVINPAPLSEDLLDVAVGVLVGLFALNTLGNLAGRHPVERWGAGGITAVLTVACAYIASTR